ncbi:zinc ABC transporter permease AztB [Nocardia asteroides]|uniref:zinc ABC transporter permease AztB n=1 Tax=Nocardia asteroides TaxID=1824 RepID=UPI001E518CF7|nr:zinc ABC transporter permease AztB [Nocardia asteroides]UGT61434.1 metal ABC transporter permease [Nocardia asteroides]
MDWLFDPFAVTFVRRALWGGLLVSCLCAIAGTWVVVRGMAFLGEAMAHGMLPGVAVAALLGGNLLAGAAVSAVAMAAGVSVLGRNRRFTPDVAIGLLFVAMLSLGVLIVSRSASFAVDLTGYLFGDVLAIGAGDLRLLAGAVLLAAVLAAAGHRGFTALTFEPRIAEVLGLRPRLARAGLLALVTLAVVGSFHLAGTLLVFGLLIAPPAAATYWAHRIPTTMLLAAVFGSVATVAGLLVSWHAGTAAGATIAACAVALFFGSALLAALRERLRRGARPAAAVAAVAAVLAGCAADPVLAPEAEAPHGYVEGAEETAEEQPRLVLADAGTGEIRVLDLITEELTRLDPLPGVTAATSDGRYAYLSADGTVRVADAGAWMVDHDDHAHYYRTAPGVRGEFTAPPVVTAAADRAVAVLDSGDTATVLDRTALDAGRVPAPVTVPGATLPIDGALASVDPASGQVRLRERDGTVRRTLAEPCPEPRAAAVTRRGAVFSCATGALVVAGETARTVPYPPGTAPEDRATAFTQRPGASALTAPAGRRGLWLLDVARGTWTRFDTGPVLAAATAGEGTPVLALAPDGVLRALDPATGAELARRPLTTPGAPARIAVDTTRAYLTDPERRLVYEIDYLDDLRVARAFPLDITPAHLARAGR